MLKGSFVALVTPFNEDKSVNYNELGRLLDYQIENKTDGIVILGTTAEAATLSFEEEEKIVKFSVSRVNKRVPLIVGSGSNETEKAIRMSKKYSELGADYVLVITPYYNKTNEAGLIKHFEMIADACLCPVIMYNVPSRTGLAMSENAVKVLSKHKNICGIKEASGNMSYAAKIARYLSDDFFMLSGNDDIIVPMMSLGATGVISVLANIAPMQAHNMVKLCLDNKYNEALKIQLSLLDVINNLFLEVNPIPVKAALNHLGFKVGGYRMPLFEMSENPKKVLITSLDNNRKEIF